MENVTLPAFEKYMEPSILAFRSKGGSMTIQEMEDSVAQIMSLTDEQRAILHGEGPRTEFGYRLAWTRTYLKKAGALLNSEHGVLNCCRFKGHEVKLA